MGKRFRGGQMFDCRTLVRPTNTVARIRLRMQTVITRAAFRRSATLKWRAIEFRAAVHWHAPMQISPLIQLTAPTLQHDSGDEVIQSLARGIEVLRAFGAAKDRMTIAEAAKISGLTRAGARRVLLTLEKLGYVRSDGRQYSLTARVLELGQGFLAQPLWQTVRPALLSIANTLNETVSAGVLDGHDVVYTVRVRSSRILQLELRAGARLPAYASSIGRVLLAALPPVALERYFRHATFTPFTKSTVVDPAALRERLEEVRAQGWCHVRDEMETGVAGVGVPLIDSSGQTIAAINVSTTSDRTSVRMAKTTIVPVLREAATQIRNELQAAT
jgi:IclR family transcriptional regulator, pca regulon regulatory protein